MKTTTSDVTVVVLMHQQTNHKNDMIYTPIFELVRYEHMEFTHSLFSYIPHNLY